MANDPSPSPQQIADYVGHGMLAEDEASRGLGIQVERMGPGSAVMSMVVRPDMLNGFKICHGGLISLLADSAFAFACNSYNELTVAAGFAVDFIAPGNLGDKLTAEAKEVALTGRTGIYDVTVHNQHGELIATFRGRSARIKDRKTVPEAKP
jgi:acyl-CoA thioesterase